MIKLLLIILFPLTLSAQRFKFSNPSFQQGGWIAPAMTTAGGIYFGIKAIQTDDPSIRKAGTLYSTVCLTATAVISLSMHADRATTTKLRISNTAWLAAMQVGSGFFNGWHEAIQAGHWGKGQFWDAAVSWENKYKSDLHTARFPGSKSVFVFVTDGYHLTSAISNGFNVATLVIALHDHNTWRSVVKKVLLSAIANRAGFYLSYNLIFKR